MPNNVPGNNVPAPNIIADYRDGNSITQADSGLQVAQQPTLGEQLAALYNQERRFMTNQPQAAAPVRRFGGFGGVTRPSGVSRGGEGGGGGGGEANQRAPRINLRPAYTKLSSYGYSLPQYMNASPDDPGAFLRFVPGE